MLSAMEMTVACVECNPFISHQHTRKTWDIMHGLEWRVPLLIELDEIHRSCVIDPDLSGEEYQYTPEQGGWERKNQSLTNAPMLPL